MWVSTGPVDHGHDVCGAQTVGKKAKGRSVVLHVLIDLQRVYDTVDGTLQWYVLTRSEYHQRR